MMRRIANTEPEKSESKAPTKAELFLDRFSMGTSHTYISTRVCS